jgi:hypothetical protein
MNPNPLPSETNLNSAVPESQLLPIPDLNELPGDTEEGAHASSISNDGFTPSALQSKELFLRNVFKHVQDSSYPKTRKVGIQLKRFCDEFCKRYKPFRMIKEEGRDVLVRTNKGDPAQEPRRVLWGEERLQVVQSIHEGEGHCGGMEKTRIKVLQRYQLVSSFDRFCPALCSAL